MNVYIYTEDENGETGYLLKKEHSGSNMEVWSTDMKILLEKNGVQLDGDEASSLRTELDRLIAWKNKQESHTDNGRVDTLQEVIEEVENGFNSGQDISQEAIDDWFNDTPVSSNPEQGSNRFVDISNEQIDKMFE